MSETCSKAGAGLFSLVLEKLVQEPAGAMLVWQGAGRLKRSPKAWGLLRGQGWSPP